MPAATIVFTDIVQFSRKPTEEQKLLIEALTGEVAHELRSCLYPAYGKPSIIALPTGDGMAVSFLDDGGHRPWTSAMVFRLIRRLQQWAGDLSDDENLVALRFGIHTGTVEVVTDINNRPNICGDTINYAQRVMDAANPRQVLLSETAFRELVGTAQGKISQPYAASFGPAVQVTAKHKLVVPVYPMRLAESQTWWDNGEPDSKWWLSVSPAPPREELGEFQRRRQQARQIAFIQLTGRNFLNEYQATKNADSLLSPDLERFLVFMPTRELYEQLDPFVKGTEEPWEYFITEWRNLLLSLREQRPRLEVQLGLTSIIGYYASYLDWEQRGGYVHINPAIWGLPVQQTPAFDLVWQGDTMPPPYAAYRQGLDNLRRTATDALQPSASTGSASTGRASTNKRNKSR